MLLIMPKFALAAKIVIISLVDLIVDIDLVTYNRRKCGRYQIEFCVSESR